jgi:branched-chain amino acid transport system permease protein
MSALLILEQALNGLQFGLMLFLLAAGLTLVFGIMDMINLAHGSLYMIGAYLAATLTAALGSFWFAVAGALAATAIIGMLLEMSVLRTLYQRDHLSQVLATFAIILVVNEVTRMIWGDQPILLNAPPALSGAVNLAPGLDYPAFRLAIIALGLAVSIALYWLVVKTRLGMRIRAAASNREMARAMGVKVKPLFSLIFGVGAALAALAGAMLGPLLAVEAGMGESVLITAFVVIVIGGIGSIRGALVGALLVGFVDTCGRAFLPIILKSSFSAEVAGNVGPALASMLIYVFMAAMLFWKPQGLFPARG